MSILMAELPGCAEACQEDALRSVTRGYMAGLEPDAVVGMAVHEAPRTDEWGKWIEALFEESLDEGEAQKRINKYAPADGDGARAMKLDPDTRLVALTVDEERILTDLTARMDLPADFRMLDASRRLGSGVSSLVAMRFAILWDHGGAGAEDDGLLQMREVVDAPVFPGRPNQAMGVFPSNHERVASAARQLWSRPDADPRHVATRVDGLSWKAMSWTSFFQDVNHTKIAEDWEGESLDDSDLADLGYDLAWVLAASHARTFTLNGRPARAVIQTDIASGGGEEVLEREVLAAAQADLARLDADHAIFVELLETEGPLLGASRLVDGVMP